MKNRFDANVRALIANKARNNQLFTTDQYSSLIEKVKEAKKPTTKKTPEDYQRLARFDVVKIETSEKLAVPVKNLGDPIIYYAHMEEMFEIIHECHIVIGHGGRTKMMNALKTTHKNITAELVTIYLKLCEYCQKKRMYLKITPNSV